MKKIYVNPEMEVVNLQTMTLLAGSDPNTVDENAKDTNGVYNDEASRFFGSDNEDW